jgi:hypothetical protein
MVSGSGSASDNQDGNITSKIVWRSNLDGQVGSGAGFSAMLSVGTHTITASATDTGGMSGSGQVSVTVTAPPPPCVRANPTVTLSPTDVTAPAGSSQTFTVNVLNNDTSTCGATSVSVGRTVPVGWTSTLGADSLNLDPGAAGSTTVSVTSPASTTAGTYPIVVTGTNSAAPNCVGTATANETVPAVVTLFTASVTTSLPAYINGQSVVMTVAVKNGLSVVSNAVVTLAMTRADGTIVNYSGKTNTKGLLSKNFRVSSTMPRGTYVLNATAAKNGLSATASGSFQVQ